MASAMRSLTLPPGLSDSSLASTMAPPAFGMRLRRTSGVPPTSSSTEPAIFGRAGAVARFVVMVPSSRCGTSGAWRRGARGRAGVDPPAWCGRPPTRPLPRSPPELVQTRHVLPGAAPSRRVRRGRRALHRPQQRAHRDLLRGTAQPVAARRPAPGVEEPGALELEQDLLEVALRDPLPGRDVLDGLEILAVVQGEIHHRLDGVLPLRRDPHARPCSISRAASFAKYVMMMSAPARRMPVSASSTARSSSSQPSWPAALSMAYSPETE